MAIVSELDIMKFTETYANDEIFFDYKMRPRRRNSTNAKYLMKMVGIDLIE